MSWLLAFIKFVTLHFFPISLQQRIFVWKRKEKFLWLFFYLLFCDKSSGSERISDVSCLKLLFSANVSWCDDFISTQQVSFWIEWDELIKRQPHSHWLSAAITNNLFRFFFYSTPLISCAFIFHANKRPRRGRFDCCTLVPLFPS